MYILDIYKGTEAFYSLTTQDSAIISKIYINIGLTIKIGHLFQTRRVRS